MSQTRRNPSEEPRRPVSDAFRLDDWLVDPSSGQISRRGTVTRVEPKAMDVLVYLASRRGDVVSRADLELQVWHGAVVGYDAVTNTVIKLRKALEDDPHEPSYIETVPKRGYRLVAQIDSAASAEIRGPAAVRTGPQPLRARNGVVIAAALTVFAVSAIVLFMDRKDAPGGSAPSAVAVSPAAIDAVVGARPTVTVLPFEVLGADPEDLYLARGLTADLIADLSQLSGLFVAGAAAQQEAPGDNHTDSLRGRYEVWGGVQRVGPRLKAEVRLVAAGTRRQLWVERYDRPFSDFFEIQDAIGTRIAQALSVKVTEAEQQRRAHRYTRSVDAYDIFLQAQVQLLMRGKAENERARDLYRRAIALDPIFARAYGGLALTYAADYRNQWVKDADAALSRALDMAQTALQIDAASPEIHWVLGYVRVQQRQHRDATAQLDQALALEPSYADALALKGGIRTYLGEPAETIRLVRSAMRQNPGAGYLYFMVIGRAYFFIDDQVQALINLREAVSRNPESLEVHIYLAAALERSGDRTGAEWEAVEIRAIRPDFSTTVWLETYPMTDAAQQDRLISTLAGLGL